jgi:uncharacterized protein DUF4244
MHPKPSQDAGMITVEYAVGMLAAAAFAGLLYFVLTGDSVIDWMTSLIRKAFAANT